MVLGFGQKNDVEVSIMGTLGISIYPERSSYAADAHYLDLAVAQGFKRVFTSLLEIKGDKKSVLNNFKDVITHANSLGMVVMVDINPELFEQLGISYDDLRFFHDLGAWGVRLDGSFGGEEEAEMTRNPYGLKIEVNMSQGTHYIDTIMDFSPNLENLLGSHNFYPQRYTGLGQHFFDQATASFTQYRINTAAFVNSSAATYGPWPIQDGLCTLESHRNLPISTQIEHYLLLGTIDDIIIGNAYASEAEFQAAHDVFFSHYPIIHVETVPTITADEQINLFSEPLTYRGDSSDYMIRCSSTRYMYGDKRFAAHDTTDIQRGDILIDNEKYGQYNGETQIALQPMENDGRINVVGRVVPSDLFLLDYLKRWGNFRLKNAD
jgi:hypothetical protein